jgi:hypothetical protein
MRLITTGLVAAALGLATLGGCGGDARSLLAGNPAARDEVFAAIAQNRDLAGAMLDRLLAADSTEAMVLDRVFADGGASQAMMSRIARDRTKLDGIVQFAVQDTAMRSHVVSLLQGIQMGSGAP